MTIQEAKQLMTDEAREKLHQLVSKPEEIDVSKKVGNDIVMAAFCQAVITGIIQPKSISTKLMKLLNSDTNTISDTKLEEILTTVHKHQSDIACEIILCDNTNKPIIKWSLYNNIHYNNIFERVIDMFGITPSIVRTKLADTLKTTIVNNVSQLISKYKSTAKEEQKNIRISITTITRLVNMMDCIITAKFIDKYQFDRSAIKFYDADKDENEEE